MSDMPFKIDVTLDPAEVAKRNFCDGILQILNVVRPKWFSTDDAIASLKTKAFTGGITNYLHGYYQDGKFDEDVVIIRIHGEGTDRIIDRRVEQKTIQLLHSAGRAQPLYASFNNGIVYRYVNGVTLDVNTVRDRTVSRLIADEMIQFRKVRPDWLDIKPKIWESLHEYVELCPEIFDDPEQQKQYVAIIKSKDALRKEIGDLEANLSEINSQVVFCHNDLLVNNIIYDKEKGRVYFIDFEYSKYNYEHLEIASHFTHYAGVDKLDFSRYPDKSYQMDWLRYYLEQKAKQDGHSPESVTDKDVEACYVKTNKFALVSYMDLGLWALVQANVSKIDFGFLEYAKGKIGEYFARKEEFFALTLPS